MAAPSIPNLNSLRRGRGGGLRSLRGGHGHGHGPGPGRRGRSQDEIVQQTDSDASSSRLSIVALGYVEDPFLAALCPDAPANARRQPLINRGTYVRSVALDELVDRFLVGDNDEGPSSSSSSSSSSSRAQARARKQIVSLGAGSDTRPFRLLANAEQRGGAAADVVYHEIDFAANTRRKIACIMASPLLSRTIGLAHSPANMMPAPAQGADSQPATHDVHVSPARDALHSPRYHIHPLDLRSLDPAKPPAEASDILPGLDSSLPTLIISECCLMYLSPGEADAVIAYFTRTLFPATGPAPVALVLYEPINPHDAFGATMVANLASRGITLQTMFTYDTQAKERQRLAGAGGLTSGQGTGDIDFLWQRWVSAEEKERIARIEMLDELEEWRLLAQHYCVTWGWREPDGSHVFEGWKRLPPIPVFLLKTPSSLATTDPYEQSLLSQPVKRTYAPTFVPVLEHRYHDENLGTVNAMVESGELARRYSGLIFTSVRAAEAFARMVQARVDGGFTLLRAGSFG
ncbi:Leucine carboxyl methyltransferase 1 [Ascosphaera acerosa]|nr:Leucine carboxyl methyltransferase 1 [Ascosphaera acerosa]